ncbi:hypothetical protein EBR66_00635 [bacterium]|nr:hypothetical protein [bacterium]
MKRLAVVASGWHFPLSFYEQMAAQKKPEGWEVDLFVVSHRDPSYSAAEKKEALKTLGYGRRELFDRIMYRAVATVADIERLGWNYVLEPNTMGDWGCINQWLEKHDYKQYDKFLFTHDDNYLFTESIFEKILPQDDWLIMTNSTGSAQRRLREWLYLPKPFSARGSFEFFTREMMDLLGGSFDLSRTNVTRVGQFGSPADFREISEWNENDRAIKDFVDSHGLTSRVKALSRYYRMSIYCLEGERGFIHRTEKSNTAEEERGLDAIEAHYRQK